MTENSNNVPQRQQLTFLGKAPTSLSVLPDHVFLHKRGIDFDGFLRLNTRNKPVSSQVKPMMYSATF